MLGCRLAQGSLEGVDAVVDMAVLSRNERLEFGEFSKVVEVHFCSLIPRRRGSNENMNMMNSNEHPEASAP